MNKPLNGPDLSLFCCDTGSIRSQSTFFRAVSLHLSKIKHGIKENGMPLEVTVYFDVALLSTFEGFTPKDTWVKMLGKLSFLHKLFLEMKHRSTTTITE